VTRDGFPIFTSQKKYIDLIKNYPHDPGVELRFHKIKHGESYWDITKRYNISIDTLIAANPFIKSLIAKKNIEIVVPARDGVLFAFNDILDVWRMKKNLNYESRITGDYLPGIFKIISTDDIRFVFYKDKRPVVVNPSLEKLYSYRDIFQAPVDGYLTSLFGDRVDPFIHAMAFHNGVDIQARYGSPIHAAKDGIVIFSGWRDGYGKTVMLQHHDGYTSLYGHCSSIKVKKGDWVKKNDVVGLIGSTGRSTGPHVHFTMMRHDKVINPLMVIW